jgi:hypothetical protein
MLQIVIVLLCAVLLLPMQAQTAPTEKNGPTVATPNVFTFGEESPGKMPAGWGDGPANIISVDDSVANSGKNSVRMVRDGESAGRMIGDALDHLAQIEFRIDPRPTGSSCLGPGLDGIPSLNH